MPPTVDFYKLNLYLIVVIQITEHENPFFSFHDRRPSCVYLHTKTNEYIHGN